MDLVPADQPNTDLTFYARARHALIEAKRVDEVKSIRDQAEAIRHYAAQARDWELESLAGEIRLRAERRAGEMLIQMAESGERVTHEGAAKSSTGSVLDSLGITRNQSSRWQRFAGAVSAKELQGKIDEYRSKQKPAHRGDIVRMMSKEAVREEKVSKLAGRAASLRDIGLGFGVILADPPWQRAQFTASRAVENQYPTLDRDAIVGQQIAVDDTERPVGDVAAPDAALFLWTTAPNLEDGLAVMAGWGFDYRTQAVWVKPGKGMGQWLRVRHEILLIGARGKMPVPLEANRFDSVFETTHRLRHSEKPEASYAAIEAAFPEFPRLEIYGRAQRAGWVVWGDEA